MALKNSINWKQLKVIIFDVDGTLYDQSKLRKKMLKALLIHYVFRPWRLRDLLMLQKFRSEREKRPGYSCENLENKQYEWCLYKSTYPAEKLRSVVNYWMFNYPQKHLLSCRYPGVTDLFDRIRNNGLKIAIYSDYEAESKLEAMHLKADLVISSTHPNINALKPAPKALLHIADLMNVQIHECLFIGDRAELDGLCAVKAGMPYLIVAKKPLKKFDFFHRLKDFIPKKNDLVYKEVAP